MFHSQLKLQDAALIDNCVPLARRRAKKIVGAVFCRLDYITKCQHCFGVV
jgi:hypothetical protein